MKKMTGEYIEEINQLKLKKCYWLMLIRGTQGLHANILLRERRSGCHGPFMKL